MAYVPKTYSGASNGNGTGNGYHRVSEFKLKEQMCDIGRRIWLKGFCAGNEGNHSYRIGTDRVLCTPTGISKGNLKPDDICTVDIEGKQVAGKRKRTSEILMHLAIYKARPDVKAVVHSHPPHATAFAIAGVELPTCIHPEAEVFVGAYSRILLLAKQIGSIRPLDANEMKELLDLKVRFGLDEPRLKDGGKDFTCQSDFISRVAGDVGKKGRVQLESGTAPAPQVPSGSELRPSTAVQPGPMERLVHSLAPAQGYSEAD